MDCVTIYNMPLTDQITVSYAESRVLRDLMTLLAPYKVTAKAALSIYQFFGVRCVKILQESPYDLCQVPGFGFLRVDGIVQKNGGKLDDPKRIQAAIRFVLEDNKSKSGHLYVEREQLLSETYILINKNIPLPSMRIPKSKVESLFEEMALSGDVVKSRECIYLRKAVLWPALFGLHDCAGLLRPSRRCPPAVPTWPAGG